MSAFALDWQFLDALVAGLAHDRLPPPEQLPLAARVAEIRQRLGSARASAMSKRRVELAAKLAVSDIAGLQARHRFVLSHALAQRIDALGGKSILEYERIAHQLMCDWESAAKVGALKLSHWRGLFRSYMQAPEGEWQNRLRTLLLQTIDTVVKHRQRRPAWLDTLMRHEHLLGTEPCMPYVDEMIAGKHTLLADLREYVDIPATSWFWQQLKARLFKHIGAMREAAFRASIESLLALNDLIPQVRDDLLKTVLERYDAGTDRSLHRALMDFALEAWKSPQLERHQHWNLCRPSVRQMVCGWLAKDDLEDFYRLCNDERQVDERRLEFWLRFKDQMGFTQILLGSRFRYSRDRDVLAFIAKKKGRLGDLTASTSDNNAILMQIGGWLFIEFSKIGTACRAIRLDADDLKTGKSVYALTTLRQTGEQWTHQPSTSWEEKFLSQLRGKGIAPDGAAAVKARSGAAATTATPIRAHLPATDVDGGASMISKLKRMGLRVVDNRTRGGTVWAYADSSPTPDVVRALRAMGFHYKESKGGFYLR